MPISISIPSSAHVQISFELTLRQDVPSALRRILNKIYKCYVDNYNDHVDSIVGIIITSQSVQSVPFTFKFPAYMSRRKLQNINSGCRMTMLESSTCPLFYLFFHLLRLFLWGLKSD